MLETLQKKLIRHAVEAALQFMRDWEADPSTGLGTRVRQLLDASGIERPQNCQCDLWEARLNAAGDTLREPPQWAAKRAADAQRRALLPPPISLAEAQARAQSPPQPPPQPCGTCGGNAASTAPAATAGLPHPSTLAGRITGHTPAPPGPLPYDPTRPIVRHLLYYCAGLPGDVWRRRAREMARHLHAFNGRVIIAIPTEHGWTDPAEIEGEWQSYPDWDSRRCRTWRVPHDRRLQEAAVFAHLLGHVETLDPNHLTLYAHSKGASKCGREADYPCDEWANALTSTLTCALPEIEHALIDHAACGCLRSANGFPTRYGGWHFSGSFFWLRNARIFEKPDWWRVPDFHAGNEAWLSDHFARNQSACLWGDNRPWPYHQATWRDTLTPQHEAFMATLNVGPTFSIVIPTRGRPSLARTLAALRPAGLRETDEVLVVSDDHHDYVRGLVEAAGLPHARHIPLADGPHGDWGAAARNTGQTAATRDYILYQDDDDTHAPWGILQARRAIARELSVVGSQLSEGPAFFFRMQYQATGKILWAQPENRIGNVSTQMFAVPNPKSPLPTWQPHYAADAEFARDLESRMPIVWRPEVLSLITPADDHRRPTVPTIAASRAAAGLK